LNAPGRIDVAEVAVCDFHDEVAYCVPGTSSLEWTLGRQVVGLSRPVKTVSIDRYCDLHNLRPDLVKVDVEGGEEQVLRGMALTLDEPRTPSFLIETHSEPSLLACQQLLRPFGYTLRVVQSTPTARQGSSHHYVIAAVGGVPTQRSIGVE
jgi:hypothetical protein